jgi:hypothetical protein
MNKKKNQPVKFGSTFYWTKLNLVGSSNKQCVGSKNLCYNTI